MQRGSLTKALKSAQLDAVLCSGRTVVSQRLIISSHRCWHNFSTMSIQTLSLTVQAEIEKAALLALKVELATLPLSQKSSAFLNVQRIEPQLVDDQHLMTFLRAEGLANIKVRVALFTRIELLCC